MARTFRSVLFRIGTFVLPIYWGQLYSRVDKYPSRIELQIAIALSRFFAAAKYVAQKRSVPRPISNLGESAYLKRRFNAFTVADSRVERKEGLPAIEALFAIHPKDFAVASFSIEAAIRHSTNPIDKITIVSPDRKLAEEHFALAVWDNVPVEFMDDAAVLAPLALEELRLNFAGRSGWVTQQLIKVLYVANHATLPTLIMDSDTVMLRDKTWLSFDGHPLTYFRHFVNANYLRFLEEFGVSKIDHSKSFVTHHLIMRPEILRRALIEAFDSTDVRDISRNIHEASKKLGSFEFAIDYGLYGQYFFGHHQAELLLDKYSNIELSRDEYESTLKQVTDNLRKKPRHNTVSFHQRPG